MLLAFWWIFSTSGHSFDQLNQSTFRRGRPDFEVGRRGWGRNFLRDVSQRGRSGGGVYPTDYEHFWIQPLKWRFCLHSNHQICAQNTANFIISCEFLCPRFRSLLRTFLVSEFVNHAVQYGEGTPLQHGEFFGFAFEKCFLVHSNYKISAHDDALWLMNSVQYIRYF